MFIDFIQSTLAITRFAVIVADKLLVWKITGFLFYPTSIVPNNLMHSFFHSVLRGTYSVLETDAVHLNSGIP